MLRVQIVGESETARLQVKQILAETGELALEVMELTPAEAELGQAAGAPDLAMVIFEENEAAPLAYLQAQAARAERPWLCGVLPEANVPSMRRALRAGADDLMFMPLKASDITRALLKISEARRKARLSRGCGVIYALTSLSGGVGVTSFEKRVALVDLALQSGGLAMSLRLEPRQSIAALAGDGALDSIRLEAALTRHSSGVYLLAAPRQIEESERIDRELVTTVLELMRQLFDFVVVDCGRHLDDAVAAAWEHADEVLYVLGHSLHGALHAARFSAMFRSLNLRESEPRLVVNRFDPRSQISPERLCELLPAKPFAQIPRDDAAIERAQMRGADVLAGMRNSPMGRATNALARRLAARRERAGVRRRGLAWRLFGTSSTPARTLRSEGKLIPDGMPKATGR
jgi:pilus assembly protein CpaE